MYNIASPLHLPWILNYGIQPPLMLPAVGISQSLWSRHLLLVHRRAAHLGVSGTLVARSKNAVAKDFGISVVLDVCCCCSYVSFIPLLYCMELVV